MPVDPDDYRTRLDNHAATIRTLKKEVAALQEAMLTLRDTRIPAPDPAPGDLEFFGSAGTYVPVAHCLNCNRPKGPGREALLTCRPCGAERNRLIRDDRASLPLYVLCRNCGTSKKSSTTMLCPPCSASFKEFKSR